MMKPRKCHTNNNHAFFKSWKGHHTRSISDQWS